MLVIAWLILLIMLSLAFKDWQDKQENPNQTPSSSVDERGIKEVALLRNRFNHYVSKGTINGLSVVFLLDTGATDVVIPTALAKRIGLKRGLSGSAITANGRVTTYATRLQELSLGSIQLFNVAASINPGMEGNSVLLGMSALKQIEFRQEGEYLILRQTP